MNKHRPGSILDFKKSNLAFVQMENISKFLKTMEKFGVPSAELFTTVDLFEQKNMQAVAQSLQSLSKRWPQETANRRQLLSKSKNFSSTFHFYFC